MSPTTGYAIADVAALKAIGASDRADGYARLLLNDGTGRRFWAAYDSSATSGDWRPNDNPATGWWKKVGTPPSSGGAGSACQVHLTANQPCDSGSNIEIYWDEIRFNTIGSSIISVPSTSRFTIGTEGIYQLNLHLKVGLPNASSLDAETGMACLVDVYAISGESYVYKSRWESQKVIYDSTISPSQGTTSWTPSFTFYASPGDFVQTFFTQSNSQSNTTLNLVGFLDEGVPRTTATLILLSPVML